MNVLETCQNESLQQLTSNATGPNHQHFRRLPIASNRPLAGPQNMNQYKSNSQQSFNMEGFFELSKLTRIAIGRPMATL